MSDYIVANWKLNFDPHAVRDWLDTFKQGLAREEYPGLVICPPFPFLQQVGEWRDRFGGGMALGVQDISIYRQGAYTGEVGVKQVRRWARYAIVGHSERREFFGETSEVVLAKTTNLLDAEITPIICVSELAQVEPLRKLSPTPDSFLLAYEPLFAIGSGETDTPDHAAEFAEKAYSLLNTTVPVLYGGSVDSGNVVDFLQPPALSGVLVGTASLDPREFALVVERVFDAR